MQSLRATPNIAGRRAIDAAGSRTSPSTRRAVTRSPVKSTAYLTVDPDQYDADANQRSGQVASRPSGAAQQTGSNTVNPRFALLFDCDGVIVETEELHRKAYNASFKHFGLTIPSKGKVEW